MILVPKNHTLKQAATHVVCGLLPCLCLAQQRSRAEAEDIACGFLSGSTASAGKTELVLSLAASGLSQDGSPSHGKDAFYIFSPSGGKGFVIVSGDERMPAVLAYSDEDTFTPDSLPPNVRYWLDCYAEAFEGLRPTDRRLPSPPVRLTSDSESGKDVEPLLGKNAWGQEDPYNRMCPSARGERCVTGCVATAMAQVMKYHRHPAQGKGTASYRTSTNGIQVYCDLGTVSFLWENMLDRYDGSFSSPQAAAVADLMFACGASVKMDYCTGSQGGSGAFQTDLIPAFVENFGYDKDAAFLARGYCTNEDWHATLTGELDCGRPVNYAGQSTRDGGHSFVVDGYQIRTDNARPYYHVNWGWEGKCNGYYQITDLHPAESGQYATAAGFNSSQQLTLGIKPEDGTDGETALLCTPNLHLSSAKAKAGSAILVYAASLENFSYTTFAGTLHVALVPRDGSSELVLGESRVRSLGFLQGQNNFSIEITLPDDLDEGQYAVQLRSRLAGAATFGKVLSRSYPELTVSETDVIVPPVVRQAVLGCSELEVVDSSLVCLNIYELQNLADAPFIGDLRMILADASGKPLVAFGDSVQPGELTMFELQEFPLRISGELTGDWPNGNYRLYVGARLINTSDYSYLAFCDVTQPGMGTGELFLDARIAEGVLFVCGRPYAITPDAVRSPVADRMGCCFSVSGFRQDGPRRGINIVRRPDGRVVKVLRE